jgi:NhaA family Na+:H+ antiporter
VGTYVPDDRTMSSSPPARPIDALIQPIKLFAEHRLTGAALLLVASLLAVAWANSPWQSAYHALLHTPVGLRFGDLTLVKDLHTWINDGLMGVFFFLVGLEIKRELLAGELATMRRAAFPAIAALGGMLVPAIIFFALNPNGSASAGWGIPMATDIAFALGVLAVVRSGLPAGLQVFLTALAIVDDIGAVLVIAVFYTETVSVLSLAIGLLFFGLAIWANTLRVRNSLIYLLLGLVVWMAFLESGIHATVAALLMAFTIPARTRLRGEELVDRTVEELALFQHIGVPVDYALNTANQQRVLDDMASTIEHATAPLQRLEHVLNPVATFLVLPLFAFANAGVTLPASIGEAFTGSVFFGVGLGLLVGKPVGIALFAWIAVKLRAADLPKGVTWPQLLGVASLGGIGFTMSLFVAGLAFEDPLLLDRAKTGILCGSAASALLGLGLLRAAKARLGVTRAPPP